MFWASMGEQRDPSNPPHSKEGQRKPMAGRKVTRDDLRQAAEKYKNWGKWGPDDEIGTLNYTQAEDIVAAARLVKKGKVISLALNFENSGPQGGKTSYPALGRINPLHTMLRTGTDAYAGVLDKRGIRAADDMVVMPLQCGTQWDGLGHVFYENYMWNGYDCREVSSFGAQKCGIEKTKNKMVGRGVFLDVARALGKEWLDDGYGITCADLELTAKKQKVEFKRGDYIVVRTGQMERCLNAKSWDGYPGGDAPGFAFETLEFVARTELAALASDTWGCEVRPNNTEGGINQPWHWITIPIMGMTMGEIFYVKDLAEDCAADGTYEFMFVAPAIPITGAVGSPTNPLAIK
jgi:kynurenine formamidase